MSWDVIGCACHAVSVKPFAWPQYFEEALCIAPATQRQPRASGGYARRSSAGKLCVLRLPRKRQSRASGGHARRSSARRLCALHLPRKRQPRASSGHARRSSARRLCVLRLPRKRQPGSFLHCASVLRLSHEASRSESVYCASVLRLPNEASRGPAAPTRAAAPPGGSAYCACHAKGSQEALCTAPA